MTLPATRKMCYLCNQPMESTGVRYVERRGGIGYARAHTQCPPRVVAAPPAPTPPPPTPPTVVSSPSSGHESDPVPSGVETESQLQDVLPVVPSKRSKRTNPLKRGEA